MTVTIKSLGRYTLSLLMREVQAPGLIRAIIQPASSPKGWMRITVQLASAFGGIPRQTAANTAEAIAEFMDLADKRQGMMSDEEPVMPPAAVEAAFKLSRLCIKPSGAFDIYGARNLVANKIQEIPLTTTVVDRSLPEGTTTYLVAVR